MKKGQKPDFTGVPGRVVSLEGLDVTFGRAGRSSPYDPLLEQLKAAGPGKALQFDADRARASVTARARKLGIKVAFGYLAGKLYVRMEGVSRGLGSQERQAIVLKSLESGKKSGVQAAVWARSNGGPDIDAGMAQSILKQAARSGLVLEKHGEFFLPAKPTR